MLRARYPPGILEFYTANESLDILAAVSETVPLAAIAKEQITSLKRWAAEAGARTASIDTLLIEELKVYSQQQGLGPLEVD